MFNEFPKICNFDVCSFHWRLFVRGGAGGAQLLGAPTTLPENSGSIPRIHMAAHNSYNSTPRGPDTLTQTYMLATYQCMWNLKNYKKKRILIVSGYWVLTVSGYWILIVSGYWIQLMFSVCFVLVFFLLFSINMNYIAFQILGITFFWLLGRKFFILL